MGMYQPKCPETLKRFKYKLIYGKIALNKLGVISVNVLLIDDDESFSKKIYKDLFAYFSEFYEEINIDSYYSDFLSINFSLNYDYAFIDIDLKELNGIDIAKNIKMNNSKTIINFISSHHNLIHNSLVVQPFYFIRKMNYSDDIKLFFELINEQIKSRTIIDLNYSGTKTRIFTDEIIYIEVKLHKLIIKTKEREYYDNRSLKNIEKLLAKDTFIRIHKSYIVNLDYLVSYRKNLLILNGNVEITIGRAYKKEFEIFYKDYLLK